MTELLSVVVHLGPGFSVDKQVPAGSTISDLKAMLCADDPSGQAKVEDFSLASVSSSETALGDGTVLNSTLLQLAIGAPSKKEETLTPAPPPPANAVEPGEPCDYRVMQGPLIKKPGKEPSNPKVIKMNRKLGSTVKTTGSTWKGPSGGTWVELDSAAEKPGWLLIEGPGFDIRGPMLEQVDADDPPAILINCYSAIEREQLCQICIKPSDTVVKMKSWIAMHLKEKCPPKMARIWTVNAEPDDVDGTHFLKALRPLAEDEKLGAAGFVEGSTCVFVLIGPNGEFE